VQDGILRGLAHSATPSLGVLASAGALVKVERVRDAGQAGSTGPACRSKRNRATACCRPHPARDRADSDGAVW